MKRGGAGWRRAGPTGGHGQENTGAARGVCASACAPSEVWRTCLRLDLTRTTGCGPTLTWD
eukprot:7387504-Prymnesium_polylepis.1